MAKHVGYMGAVEALCAAQSYTDVSAAYMDYDGAAFAQFGAKGGGSLGVKIRTVLAGVALTVLTFATTGAATFVGVIRNDGAAGGFAMGIINGVPRITYTDTGGGNGDFIFLSAGNADARLQTGSVIAETDAVFDLGLNTGAHRFRDLFLSRNASIGGNVSIGSQLSFAGAQVNPIIYNNAGTTQVYYRIITTNSDVAWGANDSTGTAFFGGGTPFASFFGSQANRGVDFITNGARRGGFAAGGSFDVAGSVTAAKFGTTSGAVVSNGATPVAIAAVAGPGAWLLSVLVANFPTAILAYVEQSAGGSYSLTPIASPSTTYVLALAINGATGAITATRAGGSDQNLSWQLTCIQ